MSRRSLRISLFLAGFGAGNKDMNLNMVFSFLWRNQDARVPSRPSVLYGCFVLVGLCSDLGLQAPYQLRCGFTGETLEAGSVEGRKHGLNVLLCVLSSFGQGIECSALRLGCLTNAATCRF